MPGDWWEIAERRRNPPRSRTGPFPVSGGPPAGGPGEGNRLGRGVAPIWSPPRELVAGVARRSGTWSVGDGGCLPAGGSGGGGLGGGGVFFLWR